MGGCYPLVYEGLKTAVFSGKDVGGTCVNRGCVPSKALLAAAGRVREMRDEHHLEGMGIKVLIYDDRLKANSRVAMLRGRTMFSLVWWETMFREREYGMFPLLLLGSRVPTRIRQYDQSK